MPQVSSQNGTPGACPRCGAEFTCGAGTGSCWCLEPDFRMPLPTADAADQSCYCPKCLLEVAEERAHEKPVA